MVNDSLLNDGVRVVTLAAQGERGTGCEGQGGDGETDNETAVDTKPPAK